MNEAAGGNHSTGSPAAARGDRDCTGGIELLIALARDKWRVLGLALSCAAIAGIVSLAWPSTYTATTKILPPQQAQSSAIALLGQMNVLPPASGIRNPSDTFVAMLKSRTIGDALVERFDLQKRYDKRLRVDARDTLQSHVTVQAGRDGVITVAVDDRDPAQAMALANAYVQELEKLTLTLAVGEASQRRLFFEKQLQVARGELAKADSALREFRERTGLLQPDGQASLTVQASANLRAQIAAREIQLAAMRSFSTPQHPEYMRTQREITTMREQLARLESEPSLGKGDVLVGIGRAPQATFEYVKLVRELKYQEALFEILAKQFEVAKIDEAKDATLVQVLDPAVLPERRSAPRRALITSIAFLLGLLAAVAWSLARLAYSRARSDPHRAEKLAELRRHLSSLR
jgi:uncharacterized protein involved in exopolysaccharide biosynthesis